MIISQDLISRHVSAKKHQQRHVLRMSMPVAAAFRGDACANEICNAE